MSDLNHPTSDLIYQLDDKPPFFQALLGAVTHLLALFVPMVMPALIVGKALDLSADTTAYLVSMVMIASGIGTWIQVNRYGPMGSGLLSIQSVNFSFVTAMIAIGTAMRSDGIHEELILSSLLGVSFAGAFLVVGSSFVLPYLRRIITPTVSGVVVLMIGLSLVAEGFGFHIPKGYLYAAIGFSITIEFFNQIARRNFIRHQSTLPLRARTADAILRLMGGRKQSAPAHDSDSSSVVPIPEGAFAEEERYMINGVLTLAQRSLRSIMTPRGEISWVNAEQSEDEIRRQLLSSPHSLFPVCRGELDEIIGIVRAKEMLVALEAGDNVAALASASPAIVVPETLDPINLLGVLRRARGSFVIVTNEFGVVQGLVTPLDVLEAIAGEFPDADETPEIVIDGDGWLVKGSTDVHALQQALGVDDLVDEDEDIATVAGLVIAVNGHIPRPGDVLELLPLQFTIVEANDYRVDLVRVVKQRQYNDEEE